MSFAVSLRVSRERAGGFYLGALMKIKYKAALLFFLAVASTASANPLPETNTSILKMTLSTLNLADPSEDARRHIANGDYRFIGIVDYSCHLPGREGLGLEHLSKIYGTRCLAGTSDAIESDEFGVLMEQARQYGIQYNAALNEMLPKRSD